MKVTDVGAHYSPQFERVDTPRTDAQFTDDYYFIGYVPTEFARQLERELTEAVAKERERCALVCERNITAPAGTYQILMAAAKEIRKGE